MSLATAFKTVFAWVVRYAGGARLARVTVARRAVGLIVYHDPSPDRLASHLDYLVRRYDVLTLDMVIDAIESGNWGRIKRPSVVITFDDGHRGNIALIPIFDRYRLRPVVYLTTESVESGRFWFLEPGIDPEPLKVLPTRERLARIERQRLSEPAERHALAPDEIQTLAEHVDFGSHTATHPILPLCSDEEAEAEIRRSRDDVERLSGRPCKHFSYPNGDYGTRDVLYVRRAGYSSARTVDVGWTRATTDMFRLPVISLADHASVNMLAAHLAGALFLKRATQRASHAMRRIHVGRHSSRIAA